MPRSRTIQALLACALAGTAAAQRTASFSESADAAINASPQHARLFDLASNVADVNVTDRQGVPLLTHSLLCHDQKLIDYLVAAGAKPNPKTREVAARLGLSVGD